MNYPLLKEKGIYLAPILTVLFVFFTPLSPSLKSIFMGCSIAAILFTPYYNQYLFESFNSFYGRAAIALFAFSLIACLWSPAPYLMRLAVVGKYSKLLYLPLFTVVFINPRTRFWGINAYLLAMCITCICSIGKSYNVFSMTGDVGEVFYNHIITGFMVAFASYLSALFVFKFQGLLRVAYLLLFFLTSYQVFFINTGKTGFVVYFILMILFLLEKLSFKKAVIGVLLCSGITVAVYYQSSSFQEQVRGFVSDVQLLRKNSKNTSLGYRVQFHDYAKSLFVTHPLTGIGTGGFKYSFSQDKPIASWGNELTDPHSQYWMTLSELGLIGMFLLLFFQGSLLICSIKLKETRPILIGILVAFSIGALTDTILCYSTLGFLLITMSALCFGELIEEWGLGINREKLLSFDDWKSPLPLI